MFRRSAALAPAHEILCPVGCGCNHPAMVRHRLTPNAALSEMLARDQAAGINVFDHPPDPTPIGPTEQTTPLTQVPVPPVDWRAEHEAAQRRAGEQDVQAGPPNARSLSPTPAPRRRNPRR